MVESDVYYTAGVVSENQFSSPARAHHLSQWDPERIVILPLLAATAIP